MSFVSELRRRQVFRTTAWYGGLAWLAVEIASTVFPQFGLPDWSVRAVIVAALLGLPVAVILAWSFDLTATGARREQSADGASLGVPTAPAAPLWRIPSLWLALALGAGLALSVQQAWQRLVRATPGERPAIAVLPFANLSPDPENAYFADGLHEEILATLARASGLRVISRTSVQEYRDPKRNLKEIADALGVALILEGSVRRAGDDLRLTLQLIDGRTDEHLWAETYDRKFRDALHLQQTVAEEVVAAIGATLSPAEQRLIERSASTVPEAYESYLRALPLAGQFASASELQMVEAQLARSIELDPQFALAHALRAKARIWLYANYGIGGEGVTEGARSDIERALRLERDLPEALAARGLYHTYVSFDLEHALEDLYRAVSIAPSDADAHNTLGMTLRRLGRFDEAIDHFREAARLAPADASYAVRTLETLSGLGRLDEAERERRALVERYPTRPYVQNVKFLNRFLATGETDGWREEYERVAPSMGAAEYRALSGTMMLASTGDLEGLAALLERTRVQDWDQRDFYLATTYLALGDKDRARPLLEAIAGRVAEFPDDALAVAQGAVALELLGRSEAAVAAADRAVELKPEKSDAVNGPTIAMLRAWVLIHSRRLPEEGYAELERLLGTMYLQPRWVAVNPLWRLLSDDERAQRIIRDKFPAP